MLTHPGKNDELYDDSKILICNPTNPLTRKMHKEETMESKHPYPCISMNDLMKKMLGGQAFISYSNGLMEGMDA